MTDFEVPEFATAAKRRFDDRLAELETRRIRLRKFAEEARASADPEVRADSAAQLREAASARDAPVELVRIARAVREGRTSWQAIVTGQADEVPAVAIVLARARERIQEELIDSGELRRILSENRPGDPAGMGAQAAPAQPGTRGWTPVEDDEPIQSILRRPPPRREC